MQCGVYVRTWFVDFLLAARAAEGAHYGGDGNDQSWVVGAADDGKDGMIEWLQDSMSEG